RPEDGAFDGGEGGGLLLPDADGPRRRGDGRGPAAAADEPGRVLDALAGALVERGRPVLQRGGGVEGQAARLPVERAGVADDEQPRRRGAAPAVAPAGAGRRGGRAAGA